MLRLVMENMNYLAVPMFACGPGPELIIFLYAVIAAGVLCSASFLFGIVCLFTKMRTLGIYLIAFSVLAAGAGLAWLGILH